ncbi:histone acetyltransferase of the GNAT family 2 isoform X3 [Carex rostrata]
MALKHKGTEAAAVDQEPKKRKRVGFAATDSGIEPNDCIKIFAVKNEEEVGSTNCLQIEPVDLNHFFGEDGKIYGYNGLQINVWLSMVSFHAYVDVSFESKCAGGKGVTDLKDPLKSIFGESLLEKEEFLQTFSRDRDYVRNTVADGEAVQLDSSKKDANSNSDNKDSIIEVIRLGMENANAGLLYSRLVSLVLLLVDGANPIDVTDPKWEIYVAVKRSSENELSNNSKVEMLGFATVYHFFYYPDTSRMRIGQILVLPPFQSHGHGRLLLEAINYVAISKNAHDITVEEPSEYLQYLRACMDTVRLHSFEPINPAVSSVVSFLKENNLSKRTTKSDTGPPTSLVDQVRQNLKINKKEFLRCWEVLIYMNLAHKNQRCVENFRLLISDRVKGEILDTDDGVMDNAKKVVEVPNDYDHDMTFVMFRSEGGNVEDSGMGKNEGDEAKQVEQLNQLVEEELEEVSNIAKKVSSLIVKV